MSWRILTESDLVTRLSGAELAGFRAAALKAGQDDPVEYILEQVTDLVRGYIAGHRENVLGTAGTLPQKLIGPAVDLALMEVMKRAAGLVLDPSGARAESAKAAIKLLERVADGKYAIEEPEEAAENEAPAAPTPRYSGRTSTYGRSAQDGL